MKQLKRSRRISAEQLRQLLGELADDVCTTQEPVTVALSGNTFEIHLEGGTINITVNDMKGGKA